MRKLIMIFIGFFIFFLSKTSAVSALSGIEKEQKIIILTSFLKDKNSPLSPFARTFVTQAEKNELDWRLVPAITGVESSFGKAIPADSYNAYGWSNGAYYFTSWEEGIVIVTKTLNDKYKKGWGAQTPYEIGRYYAASPTWGLRVISFMEQIENTTLKVSDLNLNL